jgi:aryl-alcohol dehydrogenase-like predicted oxidoreductase
MESLSCRGLHLRGIGNSAAVGSGKFDRFNQMAAAKVSVFALTIAWHLANSSVLIPIPGATRKESILTSHRRRHCAEQRELTQLNGSLPQDLAPSAKNCWFSPLS